MTSGDFSYLWRQYITECNADIVALTIILWDYFLTLDDEITFFWRRQRSFSLPNVLFFGSRYWAIIVVMFNTVVYIQGAAVRNPFCQFYFRYIYYNTGILNILLVQLIMAARLCAMYSDNRLRRQSMGVALSVLALMCSLSSVTITNVGASLIFGSAAEQIDENVCLQVIAGQKQVSNWTIWMPVLMFDFSVFGLAATKSTSYLRRITRERLARQQQSQKCRLSRGVSGKAADGGGDGGGEITLVRKGTTKGRAVNMMLKVVLTSPSAASFLSSEPEKAERERDMESATLGNRLIRVLRRDTVVYFGAIFALYIANAWTWGHHKAGIFQSPTIAINSILSSRTLINLRKEASKPDHLFDNFPSPLPRRIHHRPRRNVLQESNPQHHWYRLRRPRLGDRDGHAERGTYQENFHRSCQEGDQLGEFNQADQNQESSWCQNEEYSVSEGGIEMRPLGKTARSDPRHGDGLRQLEQRRDFLLEEDKDSDMQRRESGVFPFENSNSESFQPRTKTNLTIDTDIK